MICTEDISFEYTDTSELPSDAVEASQKSMSLMLPDDTYLSEVTFVKYLGKGRIGTAVLYCHKITGSLVVDKTSNMFCWDVTVSEVHCMTRVVGNKYFVSPLAYFRSPTQLYTCHLIMEYFPGKNLCEYFRDKILTMNELQNILRQIGEALAYLHSKGIIHIDVKPSNILINKNFECKLIDFTHSMLGPRAKGRWGTSMFAAPEVIAHKCNKNAPPFGYSCDYYSLGVTALSLAPNLCHPDLYAELWGSRNKKHLATAVAAQSVLNPDGPEDTFCDLITQLLEEDSDKRIGDATFLSHSFFNKEFQKQRSGTLCPDDLVHGIKKFKPKRYRKSILRSETAALFHAKILQNENARAITVQRLLFILNLIRNRYGMHALNDPKMKRTHTSLLSRLKQGLKISGCPKLKREQVHDTK